LATLAISTVTSGASRMPESFKDAHSCAFLKLRAIRNRLAPANMRDCCCKHCVTLRQRLSSRWNPYLRVLGPSLKDTLLTHGLERDPTGWRHLIRITQP
jgi:hypothetical protein